MRQMVSIRMLVCYLLLNALLGGLQASSQTYLHGYLRYEVIDHECIIVGYTGRKESVTVPAIIDNDPVSTIAAGAFANAKTLKTIYLPDTVLTIEDGAFAEGQEVVRDYNLQKQYEDVGGIDSGTSNPGGSSDGNQGGSGESLPTETTNSGANDGSEVPGGSGEAGSTSEQTSNGGTVGGSEDASGRDSYAFATNGSNEPVGIQLAGGGLLAVDTEGNLVYVDAQGTETVLDDSQDYVRVMRDDGTLDIQNTQGVSVDVNQEATGVSLQAADGNVIELDVPSNTIHQPQDDNIDVSFEIPEPEETATASKESTESSNSKDATEKDSTKAKANAKDAAKAKDEDKEEGATQKEKGVAGKSSKKKSGGAVVDFDEALAEQKEAEASTQTESSPVVFLGIVCVMVVASVCVVLRRRMTRK